MPTGSTEPWNSPGISALVLIPCRGSPRLSSSCLPGRPQKVFLWPSAKVGVKGVLHSFLLRTVFHFTFISGAVYASLGLCLSCPVVLHTTSFTLGFIALLPPSSRKKESGLIIQYFVLFGRTCRVAMLWMQVAHILSHYFL